MQWRQLWSQGQASEPCVGGFDSVRIRRISLPRLRTFFQSEQKNGLRRRRKVVQKLFIFFQQILFLQRPKNIAAAAAAAISWSPWSLVTPPRRKIEEKNILLQVFIDYRRFWLFRAVREAVAHLLNGTCEHTQHIFITICTAGGCLGLLGLPTFK